MNMMLPYNPGVTLEQAERFVIECAMKWFQGNKLKVADAVGCAIRTLDSKLEKYAEEDRGRDNQEAERIGAVAANLDYCRNGRQAKSRQDAGGIPLESTPQVSQEQSLSVSKRIEVQKMPSEIATSNRHQKRSR